VTVPHSGSPRLPARPYPPPLAARTNGMAIGALIAGILFFTWIGAVLAVVLGHLARGQIRRAGGWQRGDGLAVAGLVLGYAGIAVLVFTLLTVATGRVD
jgi:Domain of unknown function (DUF4190)